LALRAPLVENPHGNLASCRRSGNTRASGQIEHALERNGQSRQLNTSPLTRPSIDPIGAPSDPCTSPRTFAPFCWSTHRIVRSIRNTSTRNCPSHVPVTSTRVKVWLVQSPRAHPRLKSASTIRNRPVHLMLVSRAHRHGSKRRRGDHLSESGRDREHGIA